MAERSRNRSSPSRASVPSFTGASLSVLALVLSVMVFSVPTTAMPLIQAAYPPGDVTTSEGQSVTFNVDLSSSVNLSEAIVQWYKDSNPLVGSGLSYTFSPDFNSSGQYKITIIVVYNDTSETHDWNLKVEDVKQTFSIESWEPQEPLPDLIEGGQRTFSIGVKNPSNDTLTYRWFIDDVLQLGINQSDFTFTPGIDSSGDRKIYVEVESPDNLENHTWTQYVGASLQVRPEGSQVLREGDTETFSVLAPDLLDTSIKWTLDGTTTTSAIGKSYTYKPDYSASGTHTLTMNSTDGPTYSWTIKVEDVDRAPTVAQGLLIKAQTGKKTTFRGVASDPDNDIVTYEWDFDGDGKYDFTTDREETTTHTYKKAGTYLATFRVTDAHGQSAVMVYPVQVLVQSTLSPWLLGSLLLVIMIILVLVWIVVDTSRTKKRARLEAEARARERAEVAARAKARAEAQRKAVVRPSKMIEKPVFEDIPEPTEGTAQDYSMVPYESKMADRGQEAEGAAADGTAGTQERTEGVEAAAEPEQVKEKEELDDLLKSLAKDTKAKGELKSKKHSAEAGAEDIDRDISHGMRKGKIPKRPSKGQPQKKAPKKEAPKEDLKATGKGADSDIAAQSDDDVDQVMQKLVDMGLAERKKKQ
jgi:hypothetical protein